jgi:phosphoribosylformimino-5-aminoimidazole carboxamide ribotide isomerase
MIVYPAIDIKAGQVVRLLEGDPNQKTIYSSDPLEVARRWQGEGSAWIHIVNLDGALDEGAELWNIVEGVAALGLRVQFGGGLRTVEDVSQALSSGVERAIVGTALAETPDLAKTLLEKHGADHIVAALDARAGKVATHGWQTESEWTAVDLGRALAAMGMRHALYTDIHRDGKLGGVNVEATQQLAEQSGLQVIASGGVRSLEDVRNLKAAGSIAGVIVGKSLYEGTLNLAEALQVAEGIA